MLTCFLTKSLWLPINVKFKTNYLTELGLGHRKVPFQRRMPQIEFYYSSLKRQANVTSVNNYK